MKQKIIKIGVLLLCLVFAIPNGYAQWRYPSAEKIKEDVIITYEVEYDNELTEKQKQSPKFLKEIIVIFNNDKLLEKKFTNIKNYETALLVDYKKELTYTCSRIEKIRKAIVAKFREPIRVVTPLEQQEEIIGFPCQVSTVKIKGKQRKIYTTKAFGLRFIKQFDTEGLLLKYSSNDKELGVYTVTATNIAFVKAPEWTYSLEGYDIKTREELKTYNDKMTARRGKNKQKAIENLGTKAPKFTLRSMEGKKFKSKELLGKVVVLNFWFTKCPPCKKEIPQLNELKKQYEGKDVEFIAIASDQEYKIDKFIKKSPFLYDLVEDGQWLASKFEISLYPTNIIIDQEGKYQFIKTGYKSDILEAMSFKIDKLLEN